MSDLTPWLKVKARYEAGEFVALAVREMAESALGAKFARPLKPARRPDAKDREANDDSFDNAPAGGMVAL